MCASLEAESSSVSGGGEVSTEHFSDLFINYYKLSLKNNNNSISFYRFSNNNNDINTIIVPGSTIKINIESKL